MRKNKKLPYQSYSYGSYGGTSGGTNRVIRRNVSPLRRPPTPSKDRGPIQVRARRAFIGSGLEVMSTPQIAEWTHPRGTRRRHAYRYLREVLERYCERVGRASTVGKPVLWRLRSMDGNMGKNEDDGN